MRPAVTLFLTVRTVLTVLAVALLGPATAPAADEVEPGPRATCMQAIAKRFERRHIELDRIDREAVCGEFEAKAAAKLPPRYLMGWLGIEMLKAEFDYAPPGARHQPGVRYRWPFEAWIPRLVSQSSAGPTHQKPEERFAIDFLMPIGSSVLAARNGRVVDVREGTPEGTSWEKDSGNVVVILHEDGTFALYGHLNAEIPVTEGQQVAAGDRIASSGNTGYSFTPHLHFVVRRAVAPGEIRAVPVRFGKRSDRGILPQPGRHWGNVPRSRRELRVFVEGELVSSEQSFPVAYGDERQLRVELISSAGATDVTTDERTRYETMTLWSVHSPERGRVRIAAVPGIDPRYMEQARSILDDSRAQLFVYHGEPQDPDFGMAQVTFQVSTEAKGE